MYFFLLLNLDAFEKEIIHKQACNNVYVENQFAQVTYNLPIVIFYSNMSFFPSYQLYSLVFIYTITS